MATFSTNQSRHLFVVNAFKATPVAEGDAVGTISVEKNTSGDVWFSYMGVSGIGRTNYIKRDHIKWATSKTSTELVRPLKKVTVTLDPTINGGNPVVGQEYILGILFREYIGLSAEDQMYKNASVYGTASMTPAQFYAAMALAVTNAFAPLEQKLVTATATATELTIEEVEQPWRLGVIQSEPVNFAVQTRRITVNGDSLHWGVIANVTPTTFVQNGHMIADMEYFYMGERGDYYRYVGFPKNIVTTYLVNPNAQYNTIDIQFYWDGPHHAVQLSESTLTLVGTDKTALNSLITATNTILADEGYRVTIPALV